MTSNWNKHGLDMSKNNMQTSVYPCKLIWNIASNKEKIYFYSSDHYWECVRAETWAEIGLSISTTFAFMAIMLAHSSLENCSS